MDTTLPFNDFPVLVFVRMSVSFDRVSGSFGLELRSLMIDLSVFCFESGGDNNGIKGSLGRS